MNRDFETFINTYEQKSSDFSSDNMSGNFTSSQIVAKAMELSIWALGMLKTILVKNIIEKEYELKYLEISQKNMKSLKLAQQYASGKQKVSVSQYGLLCRQDVENKTTDYQSFEAELLASIKKSSDDSACDTCANARYDLKTDMEYFDNFLN